MKTIINKDCPMCGSWLDGQPECTIHTSGPLVGLPIKMDGHLCEITEYDGNQGDEVRYGLSSPKVWSEMSREKLEDLFRAGTGRE